MMLPLTAAGHAPATKLRLCGSWPTVKRRSLAAAGSGFGAARLHPRGQGLAALGGLVWAIRCLGRLGCRGGGCRRSGCLPRARAALRLARPDFLFFFVFFFFFFFFLFARQGSAVN